MLTDIATIEAGITGGNIEEKSANPSDNRRIKARYDWLIETFMDTPTGVVRIRDAP